VGALLRGRPIYARYVEQERERVLSSTDEIKSALEDMHYLPRFSIVVDAEAGGSTLASIRGQIYQEFDIVAPGDPLSGDFLVFVQSGQTLEPDALVELVFALNKGDDIDLVYADEDFVSESGKYFAPFYKPDWSPDYLETFNYVGFPACFRRSVIQGSLASGDRFDFVLRVTEHARNVRHVRKVLGHSPRTNCNPARDIAALQGRLARTGRSGAVTSHPKHQGCYQINIDLPREPLVSIIIPTAAKTITVGARKIDLISNIVRQIRDVSTYKNVEIIVIDNGNLSRRQIAAIDEAVCKRITYEEEEFNVARKLNLGATIANGEYFLLLNDDMEIVEPSWVERMLEHFEKPHVGVVGARLTYPDGKLQHVGVACNFGNPDHVRKMFPGDDPGYFFSTCGVRNYSAVTGACMMVRSKIYRDVGGYTEELAICFNDVDFCLKVSRKGLSIVYAPAVHLTHMESQSRSLDMPIKELIWFHTRWSRAVRPDRLYNEQFLMVEPPTFEPRFS
jgi:GT2 family glycosyltransferase